jgi:hypothetical protein
MSFDMPQALAVLERTPSVLHGLLDGLPDAWLAARPTEDDWDARAVVCHLLYTERVDWLVRARLIMEAGPSVPFPPVEHGDQSHRYAGQSTPELVNQFAEQRATNLAGLDALGLTAADLERRGLHPALGEVTMRQLLATWVVHDHNHILQLQEALASHYVAEVGPWRAMLGVLDRVDH